MDGSSGTTPHRKRKPIRSTKLRQVARRTSHIKTAREGLGKEKHLPQLHK